MIVNLNIILTVYIAEIEHWMGKCERVLSASLFNST